MSDSLRPHELQPTRLPCPSLSPTVCLDSCPLSQWCMMHAPNHVILCCPLLLMPSIFLSTWVFPNELALRISWIIIFISPLRILCSHVYIMSSWSIFSRCPPERRMLLLWDSLPWMASVTQKTVLCCAELVSASLDPEALCLDKSIKDSGLPWWLSGEESACQCKRGWFSPWVWKIPCRRKWQPTPVFWPGKFHGQKSLVGYSPWGLNE